MPPEIIVSRYSSSSLSFFLAIPIAASRTAVPNDTPPATPVAGLALLAFGLGLYAETVSAFFELLSDLPA